MTDHRQYRDLDITAVSYYFFTNTTAIFMFNTCDISDKTLKIFSHLPCSLSALDVFEVPSKTVHDAAGDESNVVHPCQSLVDVPDAVPQNAPGLTSTC